MSVSQNGWPNQPSSSATWPLPQITGRVLAGPVWVVMFWFARQYQALVENIDRAQSWGWSYRKIAGSKKWSNHASGTAIDINATLHPAGRSGTFSPAQSSAINSILAGTAGVLRWGVSFDDEMHFEIAPGIKPRHVAALACRLLQRSLNSRGAGLVIDGVRGPKTDAALRAYQRANGLTVDGIDGPKTWASLTSTL